MSQNRGVTEWLKFMKSPTRTLLLKQGNLGLIAHGYVQTAFENLQGGRLYNISGQYLSHITVKKCFLTYKGNLLCFSLGPLFLVLSLGTTEKSLSPSYLLHSFKYLYTWLWDFPEFLFPGLKSPNSLSLSSFERWAGPLTIFVALWWTIFSISMSVLCGEVLDRVQCSWCSFTSDE